MYIEIAIGPPAGISFLQQQTLYQHYSAALNGAVPQMSFVDIRDVALSPDEVFGMINADFDQLLDRPALPYLSVGCSFFGRPTLICFQPSELSLFLPALSHRVNPHWRILPKVDATIYFCDGSGERLNASICSLRSPYYNTGQELLHGEFVIWHCSSIPYPSSEYQFVLATLTAQAYFAAQTRLIQTATRFVWHERQSGIGTSPAGRGSAPEDYTPIRLLSEIDMNPAPTAGAPRENHCEAWRVRGHYRNNPYGGDPIWVNSYVKGPGRNNPEAETLKHNYVKP